MNSSPDHVEFLSRSENRVRVLDAVNEQPRTRNELKELTDVSRFTLSRILSDFEDREWIVRAGKQYETTGKGAVVAAEFEALLANFDVAETANGTAPGRGVRLRPRTAAECGGDHAVQVRSHCTHPSTREVLHESDHVRAIATGVAYEMIEAIR